MGKRSYFSQSPEFYENFHKMISNYSMAHEGEPAISLEMLEAYMENNADEAEKFMRMFQIISYGLQAQEGGIAKYEQEVAGE